jgi:aminoglycoside phosphotransferase (APT) family kinase protein
VGDLESPKSGFSNETVFFTAATEGDRGRTEKRYVLRRAGTGEAIYPIQKSDVPSSIETQRRVLHGLADAGFGLAPEVVASESTDLPLGRPFFVMEFVAGRVLPDFPSYAEAGYFKDEASPTVRRNHIETGLAGMAGVHRIDWRRAGLDWLDRRSPSDSDSASRMQPQLALWREYNEAIPACRENALLERSLRWLEQERPPESPPGLSWGDARIQNMIFDDKGTCQSIVDWEGAAILPPEADLAWWLGVDQFVHEWSGAERLPGELTQSEQVSWYEAQLGRSVHHLPYYRVFAAFRTVALMISTYDRLAAMGISDAGSAADNPFETILAEALEAATDNKEIL